AGFEADIQGIGDHRNIGVGGTIQFIPPVIGSGVSMSTSLLQMPAPGSGIGTAAKSLDGRASEDALNPSAQSRRGFTLALPNRPEHSQHVVGFDLIDRQVADNRKSVVHE